MRSAALWLAAASLCLSACVTEDRSSTSVRQFEIGTFVSYQELPIDDRVVIEAGFQDTEVPLDTVVMFSVSVENVGSSAEHFAVRIDTSSPVDFSSLDITVLDGETTWEIGATADDSYWGPGLWWADTLQPGEVREYQARVGVSDAAESLGGLSVGFVFTDALGFPETDKLANYQVYIALEEEVALFLPEDEFREVTNTKRLAEVEEQTGQVFNPQAVVLARPAPEAMVELIDLEDSTVYGPIPWNEETPPSNPFTVLWVEIPRLIGTVPAFLELSQIPLPCDAPCVAPTVTQ